MAPIKFLDLVGQYELIAPEIDAAIQSVIGSASFISGKAVRDFEYAFAAFQRCEYCVGVANGTDALEIALEALALPKESEVIVPALSFIATSEAVTRSGHRVVFADVDEQTYLLDVNDVARRITDRTKAIVAVHLYGQACDMEALQALARRHDIRLVEDCSQAHGAETAGRRVGGLGDIGTFSFYPGKNLGAYGDAGAITTNSAAIAERCRLIANHGRVSKYDHLIEGRNSRLDTLQAAILLAKLPHLEEWTSKRQEVAIQYQQELTGVSEISLPAVGSDVRHVFHLYVIRAKGRDQLRAFLAERNIESGVHYPVSLPKLQPYVALEQWNEPMTANRIDAELLSLPIGEHLHREDVTEVATAVRDFYLRNK